jgi:hypothetical protein
MRDPRIDPRAGDVLTAPRYSSGSEQNIFAVTERAGEVVHYRFNHCDGFRTSIANWRMGRASAAVVHTAEESAHAG